MNAPPSKPTSPWCEEEISPSNVIDLTPEFSAIFNDPDTGDTGEYYDIWVNTASDFTGTDLWYSMFNSISSITNGTRSPNISYAGTSLSANGATYYWKIRFQDRLGGISGTWSDTQQFTMQRQPNAPTELLTDGQTNPAFLFSLTPTFSAIYNDVNSHSATSYEIEVNSNNTFTGTVMWDTGKLATNVTEGSRSPDYTYNGIGLSNSSTTYYWRIRFWDSDNLTGDWSSTATFTTSLNRQLFEGVQMEGIQVN
jgi:hypothetical protein